MNQLRTTQLRRAVLGARELTREDLTLLREPRAKLGLPQKLRETHHRVARLIAAGLQLKDVALRTGYTRYRISMLQSSPAFVDLVAHYREKIDEAFVDSMDDYYDLAAANMLMAERQIADQLEAHDEGEVRIPIRDLVTISRDAADRFGYGKHQTNTNINMDFANQLEATIRRSGKTVEVARAGSVSPPSPRHVRATGRGARENQSRGAPLPSPFRRVVNG